LSRGRRDRPCAAAMALTTGGRSKNRFDT
jgi:hypothetical protein